MREHSDGEANWTSQNGFIYQLHREKGRERKSFHEKNKWAYFREDKWTFKETEDMTICDNTHFCSFSSGESGWSWD